MQTSECVNVYIVRSTTAYLFLMFALKIEPWGNVLKLNFITHPACNVVWWCVWCIINVKWLLHSILNMTIWHDHDCCDEPQQSSCRLLTITVKYCLNKTNSINMPVRCLIFYSHSVGATDCWRQNMNLLRNTERAREWYLYYQCW